MAELDFPKGVWRPESFQRFHAAVHHATQNADFDTGWVATPATKLFKHNLKVIPAEVWVYASDYKDGRSFVGDTFSVTSTDITIGGPKAFCRVRINKGG